MLSVFVTYVGGTSLKYGILGSISETYYRLPKNKKFLFTFFCWGIAFPAMIIASKPLMFFASAGICFAGAAAAFKEKLTHDVHMIGAFCWSYIFFIIYIF